MESELKEKSTDRVIHRCPFCDFYTSSKSETLMSVSLAHHFTRVHPKQKTRTKNKHYVESRYPGLDLEKLIHRYSVEKLENMLGLMKKGIYIKQYLKSTGILRSMYADNSFNWIHKEQNGWIQSQEDIKAYRAENSRIYKEEREKIPPLERLEKKVQRSRNSSMRGKHPELADAKEALIRLNFLIKEQDTAQVKLDAQMGLNTTIASIRRKRAVEQRTETIKQNYQLLPDKFVVDPNGIKRSYKNLPDFCREEGLTRPLMCMMILGIRPHHKGWTAYVPSLEQTDKDAEVETVE